MCTSCSPVREYVRLFDVTERTSLHRHATGRRCSHCGGELRDTIVHFGERGTLEQPLNWKGATEAANMADVILCLGSSLKAGSMTGCRFGALLMCGLSHIYHNHPSCGYCLSPLGAKEICLSVVHEQTGKQEA